MIYVGRLRKESYVVLFHYSEEQGYRATVYENGRQQAVRYHQNADEVREKYAKYFGENEVGSLRFVSRA